MNSTHSSFTTRLKVGFFSFAGLLTLLALTVIVNNRPFWWRPCQMVRIQVEDATGIKSKSPIRSLGIQIGYLSSVALSETHVTLGICLTAPVEVLPTTRAYLRGEGFLGDKFVELKPVKYLENPSALEDEATTTPTYTPETKPEPADKNASPAEKGRQSFYRVLQFLLPGAEAQAAEAQAAEGKRKGGQEIPVGKDSQDIQHLVTKVDQLVNQMGGLADNLKQAINPDDLRRTMKQLNVTLENASKTLSPEGGLNQTAQRTLAKLEDAIEQLRDMLTRVNKGEGSLGMLLNDPTYAEEIHQAIRNVNKLLSKVGDVRFVVDLGAAQMTAYNGGRGYFNLAIWPRADRYYLLGIASDSRGRISNTTVTTTAGGQTQVTQTQVVDQTSLLLTGMMGKIFFNRLDIALGALYGDGAVSIGVRLGPNRYEERIQLKNDVYVRNSAGSFDDRITLSGMPIPNIYLRVGVESMRGYNGQIPLLYGAGITFDDEDIKLLFTLK